VTQRHRTLLAQLVAEGERSQAEVLAAWNRLAKSMKEKVSLSPRQFDRWLAGELDGMPRPAARRVSERFWERPIAKLLAPPSTPEIADKQLSPPAAPVTDLRTLVMTAANESGDHAAENARFIDATSIEILRDQISQAARTYATTSTLSAFTNLLQIRNRAYLLLDRTGQPDQERELFLLSSQACALLAGATFDLGYPHEASLHARSAHTYARLIGHRTAQAFSLAIQSTLALWQGQPSRGLDYADEGLKILPEGTAAVRLNAVAARCWALRGDQEKAHDLLQAAHDSRSGPIDAMCDEIGGEFAFSEARTAFSAGATYLALEEGADAVEQASRALSLYKEAPPQDRWYGGEFGARADLVAAYVLAGDLDMAETELAPLMDMPVDRRTERLLQRAHRIQRDLCGHRFRGDDRAAQLSVEMEGFISDASRLALPSPDSAA
jgi:hypothetical protein